MLIGNSSSRGARRKAAIAVAFCAFALTYAARTMDGDAARADTNGFYHGIIVRHAGVEFVLCGPPVAFVPGQPEQFALL